MPASGIPNEDMPGLQPTGLQKLMGSHLVLRLLRKGIEEMTTTKESRDKSGNDRLREAITVVSADVAADITSGAAHPITMQPYKEVLEAARAHLANLDDVPADRKAAWAQMEAVIRGELYNNGGLMDTNVEQLSANITDLLFKYGYTHPAPVIPDTAVPDPDKIKDALRIADRRLDEVKELDFGNVFWAAGVLATAYRAALATKPTFDVGKVIERLDLSKIRHLLSCAQQVIDCSDRKPGLIGMYADTYDYAKHDFNSGVGEALTSLAELTAENRG